jgi:hypothetical protein
MPNNAYDDYFDAAGKKYNVDPQLAKTVFHMESSGGKNTGPGIPGDPDSPIGSMQMRPSTAKMLGVDPKDIHQAIDGATRYLAQGLNETQSPEGALKYYYGGPDQSGWKEKTNAYAARGAALYPTMALKAGESQPAATGTVDSDFANRWGISEPANSNAAPTAAPATEDDFASRWGIGQAPTATSAPAPTAPTEHPQAPSAALPAPEPVSTADKYAGWDVPGAAPQPVTQQQPGPLSYEGVTRALAPTPNTTYGSVLPFAVDNATGQRRFAMPTSLRDLAQGFADLAHGPTTGTMTPQATMALSTLVPGLTPSPAAGTGSAIAAANGSTEVPKSVFDRASVARAGQIRDIADQNKLQADAPLSPEFKANPGVTSPQTVAAPAAVEQNPLAAAEQPRAANPLSTNAATPKPEPAAPITPPASAQEAKELAAIPEKVPPAPLIPPSTESAAGSRADTLLKHFSTRQGQGASDDLVPNYTPTLAQKYNDPGLATLERGLQSTNPGPFALRAEANQKAIGGFVDNLRGHPEDIINAEAQRDSATAGLRDAAFANKSPVDAAPVSGSIDSILAGPDGKRAAISKTLTDVQKSLHVGGDVDAPLETDPEMLYGVRKHINDLLSPVAQRDNPELQAASSQLSKVKSALDEAIEAGAPGFKSYVAEFAKQSKPIDAMKFLQSSNLTDSNGTVTLQKVDGLIKSIQKQQSAPGIQKASAVTDEQLKALNTLRNTLRAQAASFAGKALGSNTFQNLATNSRVAGVAGNPLVALGMAGAGAYAGGPLGALVATGARMAGTHITHKAEELVGRALTERLLNIEGKGDAAFTAASKTAQNPLSSTAP